MRYYDDLYKAFLEQMDEFENFRMSYVSARPAVPLERDDPDVRRLVEAMAFFAARTRIAGLRNISAVRQRLFQQLFPYLLSPVPAMAVIQARPTARFAESVTLPAGTEIAVGTVTKGAGIFRLQRSLRVLPLNLGKLSMHLLPGRGFRLVLPLCARFALNESLKTISFHITHLNDYHASLRLLHLLERNLFRAGVIYDEPVDELTKTTTCNVSFGSPAADDEDTGVHPIEREREFFHFPTRDLYMNVNFPEPPRNWRKAFLCLDLGAGWPKNLTVNDTMFQLFTVPMSNIAKASAAPITCDGTKERFLIRHPSPEGRWALHSVRGVFRAGPDGMTPVRAGIVSGGRGSYEIERVTDRDGNLKAFIDIHTPGAFDEPFTVSIDAHWFQPWFSSALDQRISVTPYRRHIDGLDWEILGSVRPHTAARFNEKQETFLHLFTLRGKARLSVDDLDDILNTLGTVWGNSAFGRIKRLLDGLEVEEVVLHKGTAAGMVKLVYRLSVREHDPILSHLIVEFAEHVERILDAWISDAAVEVKVEGLANDRR